MQSILSKFSRRGRKNACETQLDSIYGDFSITSPTDAGQSHYIKDLKNVKEPKVDVQAAQQSSPDISDGMTPIEDSPCTTVTAAELSFRFVQQRYDADKGQLPKLGSFPPTPRRTPTQSPALSVVGSQTSSTSPDNPALITVTTHIKLNNQPQNNAHHTNALAIYGIASPVETVPSPESITDEALAQARQATSNDSEQSVEVRYSVSAGSRSSLSEGGVLARRPKRIDSPLLERPSSTVHTPYASLNAAAATQTVQSPRVASLTSVSEVSPGDEGDDEEIDITLMPETTDGDRRKSYRSQSVASNWPLGHESHTSMRGLASPFIAPAAQNPANHQDFTRLFDLRTPGLPYIPGAPTIDEMSYTSSQMDEYSTRSSPRASYQRAHSRSSSISDTFRFQSPPLGATENKRRKPPPLSSCERMRTQSPRIGTTADVAARSREPSVASVEVTPSNVPAIQSIARLQHQRSASFEPPASPAFYETTTTNMPNFSKNLNQPVQRRLQSDHGNHSSNEDLRAVASDSNPASSQKLISNDPAVFSKRSRSQVPFVSPDLRKRQAFSTSPHLNNTPYQQPTSGGSFYDEIRNDYRLLSREARIAKNVDMMAKFAATDPSNNNNNNNKPKQKPRSKSATRAKDSSATRKSLHEKKSVVGLHQLVPSYKDIWE